jgi:pilus assembly protein CpaF
MCVSIRRFTEQPLSLDHFAPPHVAQLLLNAVHQRSNILVSGKTGSGKTSLLNVLCSHLHNNERVLCLEDVRELRMRQPNAVQLETRPSSAEGVTEISMTDLVRTALRLRPDRLVVGEIRGAEVIDMLAALNTGHSGSMSTCHAHSASQALGRIESLMLQHCPQWTREIIRDHIGSAIDLVVHVARNAAGQRYISEIVEVPQPFTGSVAVIWNSTQQQLPHRQRIAS